MDKIKKSVISVRNALIDNRATVTFVVTAVAFGTLLIDLLNHAVDEKREFEGFLAEKDLLSEYHKTRHEAS